MLSVIVTLIFLCSVGVLFCFMGKNMFYPLLSMGYLFSGVSICLLMFDSTLVALLSGVVIGTILVLLTKFLYKTSLAISGAGLGIIISYLIISPNVTISEPLNYIIYVTVALSLAILFVVKSNFIIILSTSLTGASLLGIIGVFLFQNITRLSDYIYADGFIVTVSHLTEYLTGSFSTDNDVTLFIVISVVFIIGVITQVKKEKMLNTV